MKKNTIWLYVAAFTMAFLICTLFGKIFAFENQKEDNYDLYPKLDDAYIQKLYSYIPEKDDFGRTTMYGYFFTKFANLGHDIILSIIYNYMVENEKDKLSPLSMDEFRNYFNIREDQSAEEFHPMYKITYEDMETIGKRIFGQDAEIPKGKFTVSLKTKAIYVDGEGFYIYDINNDEESSTIVERIFYKYAITDNNNTIYIYDYYVKCEKNTFKCYDNEKGTKLNSVIINDNGNIYLANHLDSAQSYTHTFKFEDGGYYWYSSELTGRK
ncbi:MAG: hypothetical protein K2M17_03950 [Bacilli bacterium]|nr:hypothetical protein [Bacilli bacterium]